jgi:putative transposase
MVEHWRIYRHTGHWLSPAALEKLMDFYDKQNGKTALIHSHSVDAAQQGFPKACKTAKACRKIGLYNRYPHKRKMFRSTVWKNTGISKDKNFLHLALARGQEPIVISLPSNLAGLPRDSFLEMRLVYNKSHKFYQWHAVIQDGLEAKIPVGCNVIGVDLGEIHPAAATDGETAVVFSARELRAVNQFTNKRLAEFQAALSHKQKNSFAYRRLQASKAKFLAKQKRRRNDIEQKVSRKIVDYAVERKCSEIAVGDVRKIADKVNLGGSNQKISNWSHGKIRNLIAYKAEAEGIAVALVNEHYTSQTCPNCAHKHKPKGRVFKCPACGFVGHRDVVGAANILSRRFFNALAKVPAVEPKYRFPYRISRNERSPVDTRHVACPKQDATGL